MTDPSGAAPARALHTVDNLLDLLPVRYVQRHRVVPLRREGGMLLVAHAPGLSASVLEEIGVLLGLQVQGEIRSAEELDSLIHARYGIGAAALADLGTVASVDGATTAPASTNVVTEELGPQAQEPAIVGFVNDLLRRARRDGATDIHLEPMEGHVRVRCRIDGVLHETPVPDRVHGLHAAVVSRIKVMARLDIAEHRLPQDGRIKGRLDNTDLDFRVSILPTQYGEAVDIRVLSSESILMGLEQLGFVREELGVVDRLLEKPHGVVLVTGPTGSGKTTTLYSFLNLLNTTARKILTIEDPIEYNLPGITQMQVRPRIGLTFARGLRSMLRHDPDVMMVGEIRDQETAETVIRVALTGHLVFSTIHTNDAPSTPARLLDMGIEPYLIASSVECVLAQRLVRRVCANCSLEEPHAPTVESLGLSASSLERVLAGQAPHWRRGTGCAACHRTGYRGRTGIWEFLVTGEEVQDLILKRASAHELRRAALRQGFVPLRWRGLRLAAAGMTTVEEVLRVTASHSEG